MFQADWATTRYHDPDDMQARQSPCTGWSAFYVHLLRRRPLCLRTASASPGFYYMKSNTKTLAFLDRVIARFEILLPGANNNDQSGELR